MALRSSRSCTTPQRIFVEHAVTAAASGVACRLRRFPFLVFVAAAESAGSLVKEGLAEALTAGAAGVVARALLPRRQLRPSVFGVSTVATTRMRGQEVKSAGETAMADVTAGCGDADCKTGSDAVALPCAAEVARAPTSSRSGGRGVAVSPTSMRSGGAADPEATCSVAATTAADIEESLTRHSLRSSSPDAGWDVATPMREVDVLLSDTRVEAVYGTTPGTRRQLSAGRKMVLPESRKRARTKEPATC